MKSPLTTPGLSGLFIPMAHPITAEEIDQMADRVGEFERALRTAANMLRGGPITIRHFPGEPPVLMPARVVTPPPVLPTAEKALRQAGRPMHLSELLDAVRAAGAFVKDAAILSSMLSKDRRKTFRPANGQLGFWEVVSQTSTNKGA